MIFEQIPVGGDRNFSYLIGDEESREAAIVDPGHSPEKLVGRAQHLGLRVVYVLNTHGHADHTGGNDAVLRKTGARLAAFARGDLPVRDGDVLRLGSVEIRVLHTPGHTTDSVCLLAGGKLVTGDTLFVGKIGGTHDETSARAEHESVWKKLCTLPLETEVWPGHDYGVRPSSTIGEELRSNPFLLQPTFEEFLHLKNTWAEYKRQHGIA